MTEGLHILIVDDQLRARQSLSALLGTNAWIASVREACDGVEAIQLVREFSPDVVLLDVRMPEMDGLQAVAAIKSIAPRTRVVVLTLYPEYRDEALASGADAFLVKGCDSALLFAAIR